MSFYVFVKLVLVKSVVTNAMNKSSSKEDTWKRRRLSSGTSSRNKGDKEDVNVDLTEQKKANDVEIPSESITSKLSRRYLNVICLGNIIFCFVKKFRIGT
ncbi:hypothetical protein Bca101_010208 [Brassica carinata]